MKSVEQVAELTGLSRRKIQECEKAGATRQPVTKTDHGYLRYGQQDVLQLLKARFYHGLGYSWPQIGTIFSGSDSDRRDAIGNKLEEMKRANHELSCLITIAEAIEEDHFPPQALTGLLSGVEDFSYDFLISSCSAGIRAADSDGVEVCFQPLSDEGWDICVDCLLEIKDLTEAQKAPESDEIQGRIAQLQGQLSQVFSPSILVFFWMSRLIVPQTELSDMLDEMLGAGMAGTLYDGIDFFCRHHKSPPVDRRMIRALGKIEQFSLRKEQPDSPRVQAAVQQLADFCCQVGIFQPPLRALESFGRIFENETLQYCKEEKYESVRFLSKAIACYCRTHRTEKMEV